MVLHETLLPDDLATAFDGDGADMVLLRACAAHLAEDAALLSAGEAEVQASLTASIGRLKAAKATAPEPLDEPLARAIMAHLVADVEAQSGGLFKRMSEQPDVVDAVLDIFVEETLENVRGWRGVASDGDGGPDAMDEATAAAAAAAKAAAAEGRTFRVAIIGGGASGLCAAIKLRQAGIEFVVIERNSKVGGVWWQNTYPEAGCDVPSHFYSFSFAPNPEWSKYFSKSHEIYEYCDAVATHYGVLPQVMFDTKATACNFDDATSRWSVEIEAADGSSHDTIVADALITACGQLSEPAIPPIPGKDEFIGPAAHTAHWQELEGKLAGKRVAVVGTGASAMQLLRTVAAEASHVRVFQQVPSWFSPNPDYHRLVEDELQWCMKHIPLYQAYYRFRLYWGGSDGIHQALFPGPENDGFRRALERQIRRQVGDDDELLEKVLPDYPPFCSRVLVDNDWVATLKQDNVDLVPHQVDRIFPTALEAGGESYEADVIIYSTGFRAQDFLFPMTITGRAGVNLRETWKARGGGTAMLGMTYPQFPNMFMCYGPSTNLAHGGSIIFHSECQVRYILGGITEIIKAGRHASLECTQEAHDAYNAELAPILAETVFQADCGARYKDANGNVTGNSPWRLIDYFRRTRTLDVEDYTVTVAAEAARL